MQLEAPVAGAGLQTAAEKGRALAHADDSVPAAAGAGSPVGADSIRDGDLERTVAECDFHLRAAVSVPRGVGERLLEDAVGRPVYAWCERTALPTNRGRHAQACRNVSRDEPVERREAGWRLHLARAL